MKFISLIALGLVALAQASHAEKVCLSKDEINNSILSCDDNHLAAQAAQQCGRKLKKRGEEKGKAVAKLMDTLTAALKSSQKQDIQSAMSSLNIALIALDDQIEELQENTELVEKYTKAMIDFPDGVDDSSSAECFNDAFHALQDEVDQLDDQIIGAQDAREKALQMLIANGYNNDKLENSISANKAATGGQVKEVAPVPLPRSARPKAKGTSSDITGTKPAQKK